MHCTAITYVKKLWVIDVDVITIILFFCVCCRMLCWIFLYLQRWRCRRQIVYTYANNTSTSSFSSVICSGFQFSWFFGCLRFILLSVELDFFDMAACRGLHWIVWCACCIGRDDYKLWNDFLKFDFSIHKNPLFHRSCCMFFVSNWVLCIVNWHKIWIKLS